MFPRAVRIMVLLLAALAGAATPCTAGIQTPPRCPMEGCAGEQAAALSAPTPCCCHPGRTPADQTQGTAVPASAVPVAGPPADALDAAAASRKALVAAPGLEPPATDASIPLYLLHGSLLM